MVDTHLLICFVTLTAGVEVLNAEGLTQRVSVPGMPYVRVFLPGGVILPGESTPIILRFRYASNVTVQYTADLLTACEAEIL